MTKPREKTHEEVGLDGVKLIVGDKCLGMLEAVGEVFPEAKYQRCTVHFYSCAIMEDEDGRRFPAFLSPHAHWEDVRVGCAATCSGEQKNGIPVYELVR